MTPQLRDDREFRFTEFLKSLEENRGALAALRRGLSPEGAAWAGMHRYVAGWLHEKDGPWDEQCFYLVAALFGKYPCTKSTGDNFGGSYRQLTLQKEGDSLERRFVALLASDAESVGVHLRHSVSLLATGDIPVDWAQLLRDLRWWGQPERRVQRRWAREYWKKPQEQVQQ
jgi:CRISPR system Cascade subunit CasB